MINFWFDEIFSKKFKKVKTIIIIIKSSSEMFI